MTELQVMDKSIQWMVDAGEVANAVAAAHVFTDYASRRPQNTMDAQRTDVRAFVAYLGAVGVGRECDGLMNAPEAWTGITWGLVAGFVKWMLTQGYAVSTINHALSTIKLYVGLAKQAGAVGMDEYLRIKDVKGYSGRDAKAIDEGRTTTRRSNKKAQHISISDEQATLLKAQPDTPQGRRDRLMMCLLLDHGLRAGELAGLLVSNIDLVNGVMSFDRPKVDMEQNHKLSADTLRALHAWVGDCSDGFLLRGSRKGGKLDGNGMGEIAITVRVKELGERIGLYGLSAHDCRHYWATKWAGKVDVFRLQEAGGWASLSMPRRYVERAKIANEGMV
jgi:integrase